MPYNTSGTQWTTPSPSSWTAAENLLGTDFIDIIPVGFPPSGFLNATRSSKLLFPELQLPDYADPQTYTDPWVWMERIVLTDRASDTSAYEHYKGLLMHSQKC